MHLDLRELEVLPVNRVIGMCIVAEWMGVDIQADFRQKVLGPTQQHQHLQ